MPEAGEVERPWCPYCQTCPEDPKDLEDGRFMHSTGAVVHIWRQRRGDYRFLGSVWRQVPFGRLKVEDVVIFPVVNEADERAAWRRGISR